MDMRQCEIKRLGRADRLADDTYQVLYAGHELAVVDWQTARKIILGKLSLKDISPEPDSTAVSFVR